MQKTLCGTKPFESIEHCEKMIENIEEKIKNCFKALSTEKKTQYAFVAFISKIQTRQIFEAWDRRNFLYRLSCCLQPQYSFKGNYIHAELASESTDINWENLSASFTKRYARRFITHFVAIIVLFITFIVVYFTHQWKRNSSNNKDASWAAIKAATIIPSIIIVMVNFFVARILRIFSTLEKHVTLSAYNLSVLNQLVVFMFFNSVFIQIILYPNGSNDWFIEGGLADTIFWLEVFNEGTGPLVYFINPKNLMKKLKRRSVIKAEREGTLQMSQADANLLFEGPEVDLADRFANSLKTCFLSLFYAPIVPIGVLIGIFGILFDAIVFNYMLLRVHSRPRAHGSRLVIKAIE